MLDKLGVVRPQVQTVLDRLKDVPVDIEPRFVTADQLLAGDRRPQPLARSPKPADIIRPHFRERVLADAPGGSWRTCRHFC